MVLPTSTRPGFAPSCALWAPAFQTPKDDISAGSDLGRPPEAKQRFPVLQNKRPRKAAGAGAARMLGAGIAEECRGVGSGEGELCHIAHRQTPGKRSKVAGPGGRMLAMCASTQGHTEEDKGESLHSHPSEDGLESLTLPPTLAQWVDRLPSDLLLVIEKIEQVRGGRVWLVGGCIRDSLSGLSPWEVDLATTLAPEQVLDLFPRALTTGSEHGTVTVRQGGVSCYVTTLRAEGECADIFPQSPHPKFGTSLKADLLCRDLTMNALAVHVGTRRLFDPCGGQQVCLQAVLKYLRPRTEILKEQDIRTATLRAVVSAEERLAEDGFRAMRAYRFIDSQVGVREPDAELSAALRAAPSLLAQVSRERVWHELRRILSGPRAALVCERMARDSVLRVVLHRDVTAECRAVRALRSPLASAHVYTIYYCRYPLVWQTYTFFFLRYTHILNTPSPLNAALSEPSGIH